MTKINEIVRAMQDVRSANRRLERALHGANPETVAAAYAATLSMLLASLASEASVSSMAMPEITPMPAILAKPWDHSVPKPVVTSTPRNVSAPAWTPGMAPKPVVTSTLKRKAGRPRKTLA